MVIAACFEILRQLKTAGPRVTELPCRPCRVHRRRIARRCPSWPPAGQNSATISHVSDKGSGTFLNAVPSDVPCCCAMNAAHSLRANCWWYGEVLSSSIVFFTFPPLIR